MAPPKPDLRPGTVIASRYEIIERKGSGTSGAVYSAFDGPDEKVALKLLHANPQGEELALVLNEIGLGRLVNHPNVCKLRDVVHDGDMYLVMDYIDGFNLEELITASGHPSRDDCFKKAFDICSGLAAIHEQGVVHRDLKPENVMIDKLGKATITDLGVAVPANLPTVARGTPLYAAPEVWQHVVPHPSADIYSLGLLLFKLFTGKTCLDESATNVPRAHADARARRPSIETTGLDATVDHIISRCLAEKPGDRPDADTLRKLLLEMMLPPPPQSP